MAERCGIENKMPENLYENMRRVLNQLEVGRSILNKPVFISSGYRCKRLNDIVSGAKNSYHMQARAVDVIPSDYDFDNFFEILNSLPHVEIIKHRNYIHFAV